MINISSPKLQLIINTSFQYVIKASALYTIDESHALKHSMQVFNYATELFKNTIYISESIPLESMIEQQEIVYIAALLHDMCDHKYVGENESVALLEMRQYMSVNANVSEKTMNVVCEIISSMSYSKVVKHGYPNLGVYNMAYHVVREADLLAGYDPDRCIIYSMMVEKMCYVESVKRCIDLFNKRVFNYIPNMLFVSTTGLTMAHDLHQRAKYDIAKLSGMLVSINPKIKYTF